MSKHSFSRRKFLGAGAMLAAGPLITGRVFAQSPNEMPNLAFIGAGGRAEGNIDGCAAAGANIYALCDVDSNRSAGKKAQFPNAKFYVDWREMLEKEGDKLDGIVVSTPDHTHAVAAMAGIKMGLHAYVEKPLTRTISEARALLKASRDKKVCTQMGNTGHASEGSRVTNEYVRSGALGEINLVHCVTNRPIWAQGMFRGPEAPVPANLDWDKWLGPVPFKPYADKIAPFSWRGYVDYGTGALGDMGAHIIDHPVWAFGLGMPTSVEVQCDRKMPGSEKDTHPNSCTITMMFDRKGQQPLKLVWFDGQHKLPAPPTYPRTTVTKDKDGVETTKVTETMDNGVVYFGSKHVMAHGSHGGMPEILTNKESFVAPEKTLRRSPGHYKEWIEAIQKGDPSLAESNFESAVPLTEILLLGAITAQNGTGTKISWNPEKMTTGNADVDKLVHHQYRDGWSL